MLKLFKGDLLLFTSSGFKKADEITKEDLLLSLDKEGNLVYDEIEEITKIYKKKYTLNKINGYFLNDNIDFYSVKNIPLNLEMKDIEEYLDNYNSRCLGLSKLGDLSVFDYIGFPMIDNDNNNKEITLESEMTLIKLFYLSKKELIDYYSSLIDGDNDIIINATDKDKFNLIKYTFLFLGFSLYYYFKDGKLHIKVPKKDDNYHFNYKKFTWNRIKSIKKMPNYNGNLYYIKLKSNNPYFSDVGFIS